MRKGFDFPRVQFPTVSHECPSCNQHGVLEAGLRDLVHTVTCIAPLAAMSFSSSGTRLSLEPATGFGGDRKVSALIGLLISTTVLFYWSGITPCLSTYYNSPLHFCLYFLPLYNFWIK